MALAPDWGMELGPAGLVIDFVRNWLRATRILVFYRKLRGVLLSPLGSWELLADILEDEHA